MSLTPPARLSDRPLHSRSFSSTSPQSRASSINRPVTLPPYTSRQNSSQQYVNWGIAWQPPTLMLVFTLGGIGLAIGHHAYFSSLNGTLAGSSGRQQWATRFGTAMSFLVVALLKTANDAAYSQYVWTLVRAKSFSISTIDKLFALTSDPTGFFGWEMMKHAKAAVFLGLICWTIPLAGVTPPATLSVVPGLVTETRPTLMANLDWNLAAFYDIQPFYTVPTARVVKTATQAAQNTAIVPLTRPAPNSSFSLQFYGPAVQCSPANSTQQEVFDYYLSALTRSSPPMFSQQTLDQGLFSQSQTNTSALQIQDVQMVVLSAFAPYAGIQGWMYGVTPTDSVDQFNNWDVDLPWDAVPDLGGRNDEMIVDDIIQQLWIQTSTAGYVCPMGNASYDVKFNFVDGIQSMVQYNTSDFIPMEVMRLGGGGGSSAILDDLTPGPYMRKGHTTFELSYMAVWEAFTSLVSGNITMRYFAALGDKNNNLTLWDSSSRALLNGLSACDDITQNSWDDLPTTLNSSVDAPITLLDFSQAETNISNHFFANPADMCRNRTLIKAIEDLAGNITISMLSSSNLTSPNSTLINVTYRTTHNVYQYDRRNLIISYTAAVFFTLLGICLGLFSFLENGVAHSTAFSAVVATTRNSELDQLSKGHSLGAMPSDKHVAGVKLRFGVLAGDGEKGIGRGDPPTHIGFGFANDVLSLKKGGKYV